MTSTRTGARSRLARRLSWLAVISLVSAALFAPSVSPVLAAGPGDNGSGWPDGGPKSDATVGGSASAVAGGASMNDAKMYCNGDSANHFSGSIDVTKDFDAGSEMVVYLAANNGSNASPAGNVSKNYAVIDVSDAGTYPFTLDITSGFTASSGGILIVFAVNQDGTVISSSKSNSLNCTEAESTPTPKPTETPAPTETPKPTETPAPTQTPAPTETPKPTYTPHPTETPAPTQTPAPTETPKPTYTPHPTETPAPTQTPAPTETPKPTYTPHPTETPAPTQTPAPTEQPKDQASILIAKIDDNGTATDEDDELLDGAKFKVYADDGDGLFDPNDDELVFGPAEAAGGLLDTDLLDEGMYWIVESTVPNGFVGSDPILVELNTDASKTCIWDAQGLVDCVTNDGQEGDLSLTIVMVNNTPKSEPTPTGEVAPATGKPRATLPATDTLDAASSAPAGDNWRIVLLAMAGLLTAGLMLTPGRSVVRRENDAR